MGLSVVHGITHEGNGHLFVSRSDRLQGAQFKLVFPIPAEQQSSSTQLQRLKAFNPAEKIIWIVDDNEEFSQYLSEILQLDGYQTLTISEPLHALQALANNPGPDLLITDLKMEHLNGNELIAAARKIKPQLPFILCSGYPGELDRLDIEALDLAGILDKPLNSLKLLELLRESLAEPSQLNDATAAIE